jgi:membrane associated rhomboid family serine protease
LGGVIPLRDDNPTSRLAWVTILLILVNVGVYFLVQPGSTEVSATAKFSYQYAAVPCEVTTGRPLSPDEIPDLNGGVQDRCTSDSPYKPVFPHKHVFVAVLLSMFLHGSVLHLGGNMLFLWVFGNNIEDRLGAVRYVLFYVVAGVVATFTHIFMQPTSTIPVIGASGAIAGVMGAYLVWFPNVEVLSLLFIVVARIRAKWWLLIWFASQFFVNPNEGVAWGAHVGGFLFGALVAVLVRQRRHLART